MLDLRESSEVPSSFIAEVTGIGLRYVALPINRPKRSTELTSNDSTLRSLSERQGLSFFDSDGTRTGALWYIRRITNDRMDHQIARREAEKLGLTDECLDRRHELCQPATRTSNVGKSRRFRPRLRSIAHPSVSIGDALIDDGANYALSKLPAATPPATTLAIKRALNRGYGRAPHRFR